MRLLRMLLLIALLGCSLSAQCTVSLGAPNLLSGYWVYLVNLSSCNGQAAGIQISVQNSDPVNYPWGSILDIPGIQTVGKKWYSAANGSNLIALGVGMNQNTLPSTALGAILLRKVAGTSAPAPTLLTVTQFILASPAGDSVPALIASNVNPALKRPNVEQYAAAGLTVKRRSLLKRLPEILLSSRESSRFKIVAYDTSRFHESGD